MRLLPLLLVLALLSACAPALPSVVDSEQSQAARVQTYSSCKDLLGETGIVTGRVAFEQCNKNCLDGCPNSGPQYCYYAINDSQGCVIYVASRIDGRGDKRFPSQTIRSFKAGETVSINGTIQVYSTTYCDMAMNASQDTPAPECVYFVISD